MILVADIKFAVCAHYKVAAIEMTSNRRAREVARPRQVAMTLSKQMTPQSLPAIGRLFGNRDHTTVMHAVSTINRLYATDPELRRDIDRLSVGLLLREGTLATPGGCWSRKPPESEPPQRLTENSPTYPQAKCLLRRSLESKS